MAFDAKAFSKAKFEPRIEEFRFPELAEFFGDSEPVFKVRGLTGIELAQALDSAGSAKTRAELAEALLDGAIEDKSEALKSAFGLGGGVPDELIRHHELVIRGVVDPAITRDVSVKIADRFPIDHRNLASLITRLTGQGQVKKKPKSSGETPASS